MGYLPKKNKPGFVGAMVPPSGVSSVFRSGRSWGKTTLNISYARREYMFKSLCTDYRDQDYRKYKLFILVSILIPIIFSICVYFANMNFPK